MAFKLPAQGLTFWPVGNGDSITVSVNSKIVMQVDMRHLTCSEDDDDPKTPIIDKLVELLPKVDGEPYLAVFALTHPDKDHCCGFEELLKQVNIGELWLTPRIFEKFEEELCEDAEIFLDEAMRRVKKTIDNNGAVESGDRVRIIGYSERLNEEAFKGFPESLLTIPGNSVTMLDSVECKDSFKAFIHAPFKSDADGERNDTSLGMQLILKNQNAFGSALLFGDHCYPTLKRVFKVSAKEDLVWNVFLAPHHCSKSVMYYKEDQDKEEVLKKDILQSLESHALQSTHIVASSGPFPETNEAGDLPPHLKARNRYEEIASNGFLCTAECAPDPVVFSMGQKGLELIGSVTEASQKSSLAVAVDKARGASVPPKATVGFGGK